MSATLQQAHGSWPVTCLEQICFESHFQQPGWTLDDELSENVQRLKAQLLLFSGMTLHTSLPCPRNPASTIDNHHIPSPGKEGILPSWECGHTRRKFSCGLDWWVLQLYFVIYCILITIHSLICRTSKSLSFPSWGDCPKSDPGGQDKESSSSNHIFDNTYFQIFDWLRTMLMCDFDLRCILSRQLHIS